MRVLQGLRSIGQQRFQTRSDEGEVITLTKTYNPVIQAWFLDIETDTFSLFGQRITLVANLLEQYTKIIRFGISVLSTDGGEPFLINDFSTGRIQLAILNFSEIELIQDEYEARRET